MKKLIITLLLSIVCFTTYIKCCNHRSDEICEDKSLVSTNDLPCIQLAYYLDKYSEIYDIPKEYAYGIAYLETRYKGPTDSTYNHKQKSQFGALGPLQVLSSTANRIEGRKIPKDSLKNDIELNVKIAMKLLRRLHNKHKHWGKTIGAYNTGRPIINSYARKVLKYKIQ